MVFGAQMGRVHVQRSVWSSPVQNGWVQTTRNSLKLPPWAPTCRGVWVPGWDSQPPEAARAHPSYQQGAASPPLIQPQHCPTIWAGSIRPLTGGMRREGYPGSTWSGLPGGPGDPPTSLGLEGGAGLGPRPLLCPQLALPTTSGPPRKEREAGSVCGTGQRQPASGTDGFLESTASEGFRASCPPNKLPWVWAGRARGHSSKCPAAWPCSPGPCSHHRAGHPGQPRSWHQTNGVHRACEDVAGPLGFSADLNPTGLPEVRTLGTALSKDHRHPGGSLHGDCSNSGWGTDPWAVSGWVGPLPSLLGSSGEGFHL